VIFRRAWCGHIILANEVNDISCGFVIQTQIIVLAKITARRSPCKKGAPDEKFWKPPACGKLYHWKKIFLRIYRNSGSIQPMRGKRMWRMIDIPCRAAAYLDDT